MTSHVDEKSTPPMVGRRAIARGAAWSVPVVALAMAAPAAAATSTHCTTGVLSWDTLANGANVIGTPLATTISGLTATITLNGDTGAANNGRVTTTATGGLTPVVRFYAVDDQRNTAQTVTITFNKAVSNLQMSLLDVDSAPGGYDDQVQILTSGYTGTTHSQVVGSGTARDLYRAKSSDTAVAGTSPNGNVDLTWAGSVTSVSFTYSQAGSESGDPFIGISNLSFQYCK